MSDAEPEFLYVGSYRYPSYKGIVSKLFKKYAAQSLLVLDAGCGWMGGYLASLSSTARGVGLDTSHSNIKKSAERLKKLGMNADFLVGDIGSMPFHKEIFDFIVCQDVLEHVKDKESSIREMAMSLKNAGRILISTTNGLSPAMLIDDILPEKVVSVLISATGGKPGYYERKGIRLNSWTLTDILARKGLKLLEFLMIGFPPLGKPWTYTNPNSRHPRILSLWRCFSEFTDIHAFTRLKESMIVVAERTGSPDPRNKCGTPIKGKEARCLDEEG